MWRPILNQKIKATWDHFQNSCTQSQLKTFVTSKISGKGRGGVPRCTPNVHRGRSLCSELHPPAQHPPPQLSEHISPSTLPRRSHLPGSQRVLCMDWIHNQPYSHDCDEWRHPVPEWRLLGPAEVVDTTSAPPLCSRGYRWRLGLFTLFQQRSPSAVNRASKSNGSCTAQHTWMKNTSLAVLAFLRRKEPFSERKASLSCLHCAGRHPHSGRDLARCQQSWPCSRPVGLHTPSAKLTLAPVSAVSHSASCRIKPLKKHLKSSWTTVRVPMWGKVSRFRPWVSISYYSIPKSGWVCKVYKTRKSLSGTSPE